MASKAWHEARELEKTVLAKITDAPQVAEDFGVPESIMRNLARRGKIKRIVTEYCYPKNGKPGMVVRYYVAMSAEAGEHGVLL